MLHSSITLTMRAADQGAGFVIASIDMAHGQLRHRLSFTDAQPVHCVLMPSLAGCITDVLDTLPAGCAVFSDPDLSVSLPGLTLARLRVLRSVDAEGAAHVSVRFATTIGDVQAALRPDFGMALSPADAREALETDLLHDVAQPVLDMLQLLDQGDLPPLNAELLTARLDALRRSRDEIQFYLELLKRHVQAAPRRDSIPPSAAPPEPMRWAIG